ncbi:MarR family transcriptional regulator [Gordonia sp. PDNC005]|uniref:MarR family winged helix-turn-helix transcriptional regulator n=1 Tax=unclassified Gordonia (in: high G+C Gram-positive bacteria) TaxID=2657482 RepID=UPI001963C403|nr:MarR family transcriptional regulator [Gordonia sp. PDNC005]QRY64176.1 MarR family transcriptional regulator [Gordonia sp. PDNC005]
MFRQIQESALTDITSHDVATMYQHLTRVNRTLRAHGASAGLSAGTASSLWTILGNAPIRVTTLAERESVAVPTMSKIVTSLVDRGYVAKVKDPDDARVILLEPTDAGREVITEMRFVRTRALADALTRLSPTERATVDDGLRLLADAFAADSEENRA